MLKKITLLLGLLSLCVMTVNAGFYKEKNTLSLRQNAPERTDGDCLTDEQTKSYLDHYFGIVYHDYGLLGGEYKYETTGYSWNSTYVAPDAVAEGEVIIVEVNDYWKGIKLATGSDIGSSTVSSLFDQIKFGVKNVKKVTNSVKTPSGTIYGVSLTTNRYYFAKRRQTKKTGADYLSLRWYDEWSTIEKVNGGWEELESSYAKLQNGQPQTAPHNCDSSLELNHFTVLNKDTIGTTEAITTFLYIPDVGDDDQNSPTYAVPYQFFYRATLDGKAVPTPNQAADAAPTYDANLHWLTSFDKKASDYPCLKNTQYYDENYANGIREFYEIWRVMPDGTTERLEENLLTLEQTYVDSGLPVKEVGYDVTYYVISKVCKVGAVQDDGTVPRGEQVATVTTNTVTLHIPGGEAFELFIEGGGVVGYIPKPGFNSSVNKFENTIQAKANVNTPVLKAGDVLNLMRSIEGIGATTATVHSMKVLEVKANGEIVYTLTPDDPQGPTYTAANNDDAIAAAAKYTDIFEAPAGATQDAQYMLSLVRGPNEQYKSNIVDIPSFRTPVSVVRCHRSGVPDEGTCETTELIRNEISFTPLVSGDISSYFIMRNGEGVVRISQPTDPTGTEYAVTYKGPDGKFNVDGGFVKKQDGNIVFADTIQAPLPLNSGEIENAGASVPSKDYIYTVIIRHVNRNTYGNNDDIAQFRGEKGELVVNLDCTAEYGESVWEGRFISVLNWSKIKSHLDVLEPERYEIYYTEVGTPGFHKLTQTMNYEEVRVNVNGVSKLAGYNTIPVDVPMLDGYTTTFTDDYVWNGNKDLKGLDTHPDFVKQPRSYYIKAIFPAPEGAARNVIEKNSNIGRAPGEDIHTMVEGIAAAQDNVTVYPNPATDYAVVKNAAGIGRIAVYNTLGSEVMNVSAGGATEYTLEVGELASGMYIVIADGGEPQQLIVK